MIPFQYKVKVNENPQINFNSSKEIAYWAKKFNITPNNFQQIFESNNKSISRTLAYCTTNM